MTLIDTHCHLNFSPLGDDLDGVLARARRAGVDRVVVPAYDAETWQPIAELAAAHPGTIYPAYGLHPWASDQPLDHDRLAALLAADDAVALGEVGLDARVDSPPLDTQIPVLTSQLELAHDLGKPVILHCRGAFEELLAVLGRFDPPLRGVMHAWSRPAELALRFVGAGLHLGLGGAVTRRRARVRRAVTELPLDRVVLETDAPSIGLDDVRPENVEPRHVADIARALAELRGEPPQRIADVTTGNAEAVFRL
jgi:TatD DNase family protein